MTNFLASIQDANTVKVQRIALITRLCVGLLASFFLLANPAMAQTLKATGVSIFNAIYTVVGVIGAIAMLVTFLNWMTGNWLGREDPKKVFFQVALATVGAFSVVGIVQFLKDSSANSASSIGNL